MSRRIILSVILVLSTQVACFSQVKYIKADDLNKRITNRTDTIYIINFWATWCVPCIKELPAFEKLNQEYKDEKFKMLLVSLDFKSDVDSSLLPFIKKQKLQTEVLLLDEDDPDIFINKIDSSWSGTIPATLIIKNGKKKFFEKNFTLEELQKEYASFNQNL